ncbi:MAG: SufE family protein [Bacteroidetes bacterium]|nr:SufE family protein [Bacteroidota bacterium]
MNSIVENEKEIVEDFSMFDQWDDKYQYIIDLGKSLAPMDENLKTENRLIKGCQSKVWLHTELRDGKIFFQADSDAIITKGLVALMVHVLSGHTPEEITKAPLTFIDTIGLKDNLSPTRSNGFIAMVKQMKMDALALSAK